jgi:hypothetical protein
VLGAASLKLGSTQQGIEALGQLAERGTASDLKIAAEILMEADELLAARKLIDGASEAQQKGGGLWEVQGLIQIRLGDVNGARLSMRNASAMGSRSTSLKLALFKVESGSEPLPDVLDRLLKDDDSHLMLRKPKKFIPTVIEALATSLYQSGPIYLAQSFAMLRSYFSDCLDRGHMGEILTGFLAKAVTQLQGSLEDWERFLARLRDIVGDLKDCQIPLAILSSAVRFTKTGDQRYLMQLPLEQRQLLETAFAQSDNNSGVSRADGLRSGP